MSSNNALEAEEIFTSSLKDWIDGIIHFSYYHSSFPQQPWATIQFKDKESLLSFKNGYSCSSSIEFSIIQPFSYVKEKYDPTSNTIEEDKEFIDFVDSLKLSNNTEIKSDDNALYEKMLKEKEIRKGMQVFNKGTVAEAANKVKSSKGKNQKKSVKDNIAETSKVKISIAKRNTNSIVVETSLKVDKAKIVDKPEGKKEKAAAAKARKDPKKIELLQRDSKKQVPPPSSLPKEETPSSLPKEQIDTHHQQTDAQTKPKIYTRASRKI